MVSKFDIFDTFANLTTQNDTDNFDFFDNFD